MSLKCKKEQRMRNDLGGNMFQCVEQRNDQQKTDSKENKNNMRRSKGIWGGNKNHYQFVL